MFTMDQLRGTVHQSVEETRRALLEHVLFVDGRPALPAVPWDALYDDPTNGEIGWQFVHDQRSQMPTDGREWLYNRVKDQEGLQNRFVRTGSECGYDRERIADRMRQVARFQGLLLVLMHITGGQPARRSDILSVRHRNRAAGGHRNCPSKTDRWCL